MPYILKAEQLETQANKVSVLDNTVTNDQYPSAKAVKDAISNISLDASGTTLSSKQDKFADVTVQEGSNFPMLNSDGQAIWTADGFNINSRGDLGFKLTSENSYSGVTIGSKDSPFAIATYGIYKANESPTSRVNLGSSKSELTSDYHGFISTSDMSGVLYDTAYSNVIIDKTNEQIRLHTNEIITGKCTDLNGTKVPGIISNVADPTQDDHAANKKYVDSALAKKIEATFEVDELGPYVYNTGIYIKTLTGLSANGGTCVFGEDEFITVSPTPSGDQLPDLIIGENYQIVLNNGTVESISLLNKTLVDNLALKQDHFGKVTKLNDYETFVDIGSNKRFYLQGHSHEIEGGSSVTLRSTNGSVYLTAADNSGYVRVGDNSGNPVSIKNIKTPVDPNDAANKAYIDSKIVISSTSPTNPTEGTIWIRPIA